MAVLGANQRSKAQRKAEMRERYSFRVIIGRAFHSLFRIAGGFASGYLVWTLGSDGWDGPWGLVFTPLIAGTFAGYAAVLFAEMKDAEGEAEG
ncbi:hypothetical protein CKO28_18745 [Rhodovibrio sodomensis]|uniref:Uncharacterized protein n=1 Tax=Rhodovibrio sodomensis TaxID=1088 RepID=A0ABS1DHX5_9PROT|nr:hypothetical protein [Rhodovibrio sodomensis]MBK1670077.1 hypothetical protein [Rhodovibrio sodomensis]